MYHLLDNKKFLDEIFKIDINELRIALYKKYERKDIAEKLNISDVQVTRKLRGQSPITFTEFKLLIEMIK